MILRLVIDDLKSCFHIILTAIWMAVKDSICPSDVLEHARMIPAIAKIKIAGIEPLLYTSVTALRDRQSHPCIFLQGRPDRWSLSHPFKRSFGLYGNQA